MLFYIKTNRSLILNILLITSLLLTSISAFAFGGGGGGGRTRRFYERHSGVDAIGVHIHTHGKNKPIINIECPEHSTKSDDSPECICDLGYVMTNAECMPKYPAACEESGFYWCATTQSCVKSAEECACPEARQCGETCCGKGHTCQEGQCCDAQGNCCDTPDSTGYGTDDGECCENGTTPAFSWWDDEENYGSFCCAPNKTMTKVDGYRIDYKECCDEDSVPYIGDYEIYPEDDYTYFEQYCCPKENTLTHFKGVSACCEPGQTAFCSGQKADGTCEYTDCLNEEDQKYPCWYNYESDYITYCMCDKNNTVTPFDKVAACCGEGETPYCSGKDENGNCTNTDCCSGTVYPGKGWNGGSLCCNEGSEPYCFSRDEQGNCTGRGCCSGMLLNGPTVARCFGNTNYGECKENTDCAQGEFCKIISENDSSPVGGECTPVGVGTNLQIPGLVNIIKGPENVTWWSANNWCKAQGKSLIDISRFDCYQSGTENKLTEAQATEKQSGCCAKGQECDGITYAQYWDWNYGNFYSLKPEYEDIVRTQYSPILNSIREIGLNYVWTNSNPNQMYWSAVRLFVDGGTVSNINLANDAGTTLCE